MVSEGTSTKIDVCAASALPAGAMQLVDGPEGVKIGVFNCDGALYAIEDRCSHDDGPLAEGSFDAGTCTVECPRHGSLFDLTSGRPKTLPAYQPVKTFPVSVEDDTIKLEVP
jgi:3-phenylpropionate/trans-cinnamate dioxygenase ferredoxin component